MRNVALYIILIGSALLVAFLCGKSCNKTNVVNDNATHQRYDSIVYREKITIDSVKVPGERIVIRVPVKCQDGKVLPTEVTQSSHGASVTASIDTAGTLKVESNCDSLYNIIITKDKQLQEKTYVHDSTSHVIKEKYVPKIYKYAMGASITGATYIIYRIIKFITP